MWEKEREQKMGAGFNWCNIFCELINNPVGHQFVWVKSPVFPYWLLRMTGYLKERKLEFHYWHDLYTDVQAEEKELHWTWKFLCVYFWLWFFFKPYCQNVTPWSSLCPFMLFALCFVWRHCGFNFLTIVCLCIISFFLLTFSSDRFKTVMA